MNSTDVRSPGPVDDGPLEAATRAPLGPPGRVDQAVHPVSGPPMSRRRLLALGAAGLATGFFGVPAAPLPELVERCRFGAYADNEPYPVDVHLDLERRIGAPLPVCSWFLQFGTDFPTDAAERVAGWPRDSRTGVGHYDVMIAWEPHGVRFDDLLAGRHDEYIWRFVEAAGRYPGRVVLRPLHESNGDWYDWSPWSGRGWCDSPDQWVAAWRRIVDVGRRAGRSNVEFAWCVSSHDVLGRLEQLWPGRSHVDVLGVDVYAWASGERFPTLLAPVYDRMVTLEPIAPFWVCELGTAIEQDQPDFARSVYGCRQFDRLTTACWFDRDQFRIAPDPASLAVHRPALSRAPSEVPWGQQIVGR